MKKIRKDSDNFRHKELTLKVRRLQTAEDQKYFEVCRLYQKRYFPLVYSFMYPFIALGDHRDPPQP